MRTSSEFEAKLPKEPKMSIEEFLRQSTYNSRKSPTKTAGNANIYYRDPASIKV